jgi:hypothetical protein
MTSHGQDNDTSDASTVFGIPTVEQLQTDPFMKQVRHAEFVVGLIDEDAGRETDVLMKRLRAQLSHSDGIRGFMVTYLTTAAAAVVGSESDDATIPQALVDAITEQIDPVNDSNDLISLMCMNVIMPTAMITMHQEEELSQQSAVTANRATRLLQAVLKNSNKTVRDAVTTQCEAILAEATAENDAAEDDTVAARKYWKKFFDKWGYQSNERRNIADAIVTVLQVS